MRTPGLRKDVSLAASCFTLSLVAVCLLGVQPGTATAQVKSPSLDQTLKQCPGGVAVAPGTPCPSSTPVGWQDASLAATDIGVGSAGHVFFIATDGSSIWQHTTSGNRAVPGRAVRIAVAPNGHPWVVNVSGEIYRDVATADGATTWKLIPGWASDIGIGVDGTVWVLGGGGRPYRWDDTKASWVTGTGIGTAIAVDPGGNPWVVNASGEIYQFVAGAWKQLHECDDLLVAVNRSPHHG